MKKIVFIVAFILIGCSSSNEVDSSYYKTEYKARVACASQYNVANEYSDVKDSYNFKVTKLPNQNWYCSQVFGDELRRQIINGRDEYFADINGQSLDEYRAEKKENEEKLKSSYIKFYEEKEKQYQEFKKDGRVHSDTYTEPDGTVRSTVVYGETRCDSIAGSSSVSSTCN